jgi:hypothetical protein
VFRTLMLTIKAALRIDAQECDGGCGKTLYGYGLCLPCEDGMRHAFRLATSSEWTDEEVASHDRWWAENLESHAFEREDDGLWYPKPAYRTPERIESPWVKRNLSNEQHAHTIDSWD